MTRRCSSPAEDGRLGIFNESSGRPFVPFSKSVVIFRALFSSIALGGSWFLEHEDQLKANLPPLPKDVRYSPSTLLKVPGPEQMKQEWIASKGVASYEYVMAYLDR